MTEFRRPPTAQEAVLSQLRRWILDGNLRPGDAVRQDAIASALEVSSVPVREALKVLASEGLVTYRPHHGYYVTKLTMRDIVEIYRVRELLESEALRAGVPKLTESHLEEMRQALADIDATDMDDIVAMTDANERFHMTLLSACEQPHLIKHIRLLRDSTHAYRSLYYLKGRIEDIDHEHGAILKGAEQRDVEAVIEMTNAHREHTIETLRRFLPDE